MNFDAVQGKVKRRTPSSREQRVRAGSVRRKARLGTAKGRQVGFFGRTMRKGNGDKVTDKESLNPSILNPSNLSNMTTWIEETKGATRTSES